MGSQKIRTVLSVPPLEKSSIGRMRLFHLFLSSKASWTHKGKSVPEGQGTLRIGWYVAYIPAYAEGMRGQQTSSVLGYSPLNNCPTQPELSEMSQSYLSLLKIEQTP